VIYAILRRVLLATVIAGCALYVGDYLVLRYRIARNGEAAATDTVTVLYGTPLKDGRIEIFADQPQTETCSRSIFPHLGYPACWYARRHPTKVITDNRTPPFPRCWVRSAASGARRHKPFVSDPPNCLGVMNPTIGLNATFAQRIALLGTVAFLS
jgi:hypothetical protein